jgi:hypothetical protein
MRLALAVDGSANGFPDLGTVSEWLEGLNLRAWLPGRSLAPPPAGSVHERLPSAEVAAVRHRFAPGSGASGCEIDGADAESPDPSVRQVAIEEMVATGSWAAEAGAPWIVVEIGSLRTSDPARAGSARSSDVALDRVCRVLHAALARIDPVGIALTLPSRRRSWLTPESVDLVFADLGRPRRLAWWHDTGRAHALASEGGPAPSAWLDANARRCVGVDATDAIGASAGLPAGAGETDVVAVVESLSSRAWVVLRSEPFVGIGPLAGAASALRGEPS